MKRLTSLLVVLVFVSSACVFSVDWSDVPAIATPIPNLQSSATPLMVPPTFTPVVIVPTVTVTAPPPTPVNTTPALTLEQLSAARFDYVGQDGLTHPVQFTDGKYQEGAEPTAPGFVSIVLGGNVAFGDLNADGAIDAAVVLAESYGGTGVFVSIAAFLNQDGQPLYVASYFVDDRAVVNTLSITENEVFIDSTVHGPNDPACCPSQATARTLRLWDNALALTHFTSTTPTGAERVITIESPGNGSEVEKIFSLKGSVTISPFENTLVYNVYIPGMTKPFTAGPLMVNAPDLGAPGTFELPFNFSAAGYTGPVRITISDLSAADGSFLAQDALFVTVK